MNNNKPIDLTDESTDTFSNILCSPGRRALPPINKTVLKIIVFALCLYHGALNAQIQTMKPKLNFESSMSKADPKQGDTLYIIFKSIVPNPFHLYSEKSDCSDDDGPIRAEWVFENHNGLELLGKPIGIGDKMTSDDIFNCATGEFETFCEFRQKVVITGPVHDATARFSGQMCSVMDGTCFQVNENITINLHVH